MCKVVNLCPNCGTSLTSIELSSDSGEQFFDCYFCAGVFKDTDVNKSFRQISRETIARQLRRKFAEFLKRFTLKEQIQLLDKLFDDYEQWCDAETLDSYSKNALLKYLKKDTDTGISKIFTEPTYFQVSCSGLS